MVANIANYLRKAFGIQGILFVVLSLPAFAENNLPDAPGDGPVVVFVSMAILDIDEISDNQQSFTINFVATFRWTDPRLAHDGPGTIRRKITDIWSPYHVFLNIQRTWSHLPNVAEIKPNGEVIQPVHLWGYFSQPLNLRDYPFDKHLFEMPIATPYAPGKIIMKVDTERPPFLVESLSVADWKISNFAGRSTKLDLTDRYTHNSVVFSFEGARKSGNIIIKIIIPLVFIVIMSWAVFWIDPQQFGSQLSMAITSVLTLIAYYIALASKIPKIPYLTRLDLFLFGSTILVFASFIEVVITSRLSVQNEVDRARKIDLICRWVFPILMLLVTVYAFFFRK